MQGEGKTVFTSRVTYRGRNRIRNNGRPNSILRAINSPFVLLLREFVLSMDAYATVGILLNKNVTHHRYYVAFSHPVALIALTFAATHSVVHTIPLSRRTCRSPIREPGYATTDVYSYGFFLEPRKHLNFIQSTFAQYGVSRARPMVRHRVVR